MKPSFARFILLFVVAASGSASSSAQSLRPAGVADEFVAAWNTHDVKAFSRLFASDAIWVPVADTMEEGRASILKDLGEAHRTWAKTVAVKHTAVKVKAMGPRVATLFFHLQFFQNGKRIPSIDRAFIMVLRQNNHRWQIAAGQLTKQHTGE